MITAKPSIHGGGISTQWSISPLVRSSDVSWPIGEDKTKAVDKNTFNGDVWVELRKVVIELLQNKTWVLSTRLTTSVKFYFRELGPKASLRKAYQTGSLLRIMVEEGILERSTSSEAQFDSPQGRFRYTSYRWTGRHYQEPVDLKVDNDTANFLRSIFYPEALPDPVGQTRYYTWHDHRNSDELKSLVPTIFYGESKPDDLE